MNYLKELNKAHQKPKRRKFTAEIGTAVLLTILSLLIMFNLFRSLLWLF